MDFHSVTGAGIKQETASATITMELRAVKTGVY